MPLVKKHPPTPKQGQIHLMAILLFVSIATTPNLGLSQPIQNPIYPLTIGDHSLEVELALTQNEQRKGLMFRSSLPENHGMIFVYPAPRTRACMWMKNTLIPLSVAFLDEQGEIVNIANMEPLSRQSHCAKKQARFALEMNQGWFKRRGIGQGDRLVGLDPIKNQAKLN